MGIDNAIESQSKMDTTSNELTRSPPNEDDECDSNFLLKRHKAVWPVDENEQGTQAKTHVVSIEMSKKSMPPLITRNGVKMPKVMHVKPKSSSAATSSHLDKIVTNLKINLLQQMSKKRVDNEAPPNAEPPLKKHELFIKIVETLQPKPTSKPSENPDDYDDLSDLTWLTNFNLNKEMGAHFALGCLSPPQSPKSTTTPTALLHVNTKPSQRSNSTTTSTTTTTPTTKINPKIAQAFNLNFDLKYGDDEADGAASKSPHNFNILSLIKPWIPLASHSPVKKLSEQQQSVSPQRPPYSFSCLTFLAIESSERKRLSVKEIYAWIIQNFPYYHSVPSGSWKNSIRHNLSYNQCFSKVDKNLLAMRDFSGKGSLWCINPEFRPLLIDMLQKTPTHEQHKLACIPLFQDVAETTAPIMASVQTPPPQPPKVSHSIVNLVKKRPSNQPCTPTIINPKILSQFISPKSQTTKPHSDSTVVALKQSPSHMPRISTVTKLNSKSKNSSAFSSIKKESFSNTISASSKSSTNNQLSSTSNLSFSGNCSEMDAVNALLTMKSRSSSMPIISNTQLNQMKDSNKKGRRKVRPPTKNFTAKPPSNYDGSSDEAHLVDVICKEESFDLNSDSSDDNLTCDKRFLETTSRHLTIKANDDDDEKEYTDEESVLKIDERVQDEPEDLSLRKKPAQDQQQMVKKRKLTNPNLSNALLELSKAAKQIEGNKKCIKKFSF